MIQISSIRSFGRFIAAAAVLAACGGGGRSAGSTAARSPPELRDVRYCEEIADRTLTIAQLPDLASKLKLPSGWGYRTETPSSELAVASNGTAAVVNDDLYSSYQKRM